GDDYDSLSTIEKDICLAINPILLQEIVGDEDTKTEATVDLETVLEFKDVMEAAIPGLTTSDMVQIISGGTSELDEKDLNNNEITDELDVTNCVVNAINSSDTIAQSCSDFNVIDESNVTIDGNDYTRVILSITGIVDGNSTTNQFYRLIQTGAVNTTITTTENNVTADGNITNCNYYIDLSTCYPEPKTNDDGDVTTFSDTVVDILNNDTLLSSMAVLSDEGDATQTEEEKIDDFKEDICDGSSGTSTTCDTVDGELVITQDAILDYMSETK
ncbi:MAG: hypothetical protein U9R37_09220, partial [Campylobacterota bacterium]|nr:hypothetical protein [Campylobacterota bacterium]